MRVGIVGAGLQARRRAPVIKAWPGAELVVISAEHPDSAKALASQMGCEADVGWEWVARRRDVDVVLVCTPPRLHAAITIAALQTGKHVLCEKPLAWSLEEAEEMRAVTRATGLTVKCGFNHRHHPGIEQAHRWLDDGRLGEPLFIRCRYGICGRPGYAKEWRGNADAVAGGQLMEQGIHGIDLARWFLGELVDVNCMLGAPYFDLGPLEDNAFATYRTERGRVLSIHSTLTQWKNLFSFEIFGHDGYALVKGLGGAYGTERATFGKRDFHAPFTEETVEFRGDDRSWREEWREFVHAIEERRDPLGTVGDGIEAMRCVFAAYEAHRRNATVRVESVGR